MKGARASNHSSPGIMSPTSPLPYDNQSRSSTDSSRLRTLESQSAIQSTEVALLRQMSDDFGSWRYRVDKDVAGLHSKVDNLDLNSSDRVFDRLLDVECKLTATESLFNNQDSINTIVNAALVDLRTGMDKSQEDATLALTAIQNTTAANDAKMSSISDDFTSLFDQVQTIQLGLDVVEQSLEGLDVSEILRSISSRMDDLDIGMERIADESFANIAALESSFSVTKTIAERADAKAAAAAAALSLLTQDVAGIRKELSEQQKMEKYSTPASSVTSSPIRSSSSASDPRLKAAVHTLTDGYRSLHRAMTLAYEEQASMQSRVNEVAYAASRLDDTQKQGKKQGVIVTSFPLQSDVFDEYAKTGKTHTSTVRDELFELRALLAAQAAESAQQARRADLLERQLNEMRQLFVALAAAPQKENKEDTVVHQVKEEEAKAEDFVEKAVSKINHSSVFTKYGVRLMVDEAGDTVSLHLTSVADNEEEREGNDDGGKIAAIVPGRV